MSKNTSRKSILKASLDGTEFKNKKKLSFGGVQSINESQAEELSFHKRIFLSSNLKLTAIGACYIPPEMDSFDFLNSDVPTQPLSKSRRADYRLLLKDYASTSVLIIGAETSLCDGIQVELEKARSPFQADKLKCKSVLQPTLEEIRGADFFIFLFQLDKSYSVSELRSKLSAVSKYVKCFQFRSLVVNISSPVGPYNNNVPLDHRNMLVDWQLPSVTFCIINRERKTHILKGILSTIDRSCNGNSIDALTSWGLTSPVHSEDLLLT